MTGRSKTLVFAVGILGLAASLFAAQPAAALHWVAYASVTLSPTSAKASQAVVFVVTLSNGYSVALSVCEVDIAFEWDSTVRQISSGSRDITPGAGTAWSVNESIPALPPAGYRATVTISARTSGDPTCERNDWFAGVVIVANLPPLALFAYSPFSPDTNTVVQFADRSVDADGRIIAWHWDFGDASKSDIRNPTHRFLSAATYHVTLTTVDDDGATDAYSQNIQVVGPLTGLGVGVVGWGVVLVAIAVAFALVVMLVRTRRKRPLR